jgi:hypothetical protein
VTAQPVTVNRVNAMAAALRVVRMFICVSSKNP